MIICGVIVLKDIKIPFKFISNMIMTIIFATVVSYVFMLLKNNLNFVSLWNLILIAPIFLCVYIC